MAGIEKICEYSGEYIGQDMYRYKANLIQVMPKYRKLFKHAPDAFVFVFEPEVANYCGDWSWFVKLPLYHKWINIPKVLKKGWFSKYRYLVGNPTLTWDYCVFVPGVPGRVNGFYWNHTVDIFEALKKIDKMIGDLRPFHHVIKVNQTMNDFFFSGKETCTEEDLVRIYLKKDLAEELLTKSKEGGTQDESEQEEDKDLRGHKGGD